MCEKGKYLSFESAGRRLYADLDRVVTVLSNHRVVEVPESEPWLRGICAANGQVVYVVDLADDYRSELEGKELVVLRVKAVNVAVPATILPSLEFSDDASVEAEDAIVLLEDFILSQEALSPNDSKDAW